MTAVDALTDEAMRRSGVIWVIPAGQSRAFPVWHLWHEGRAYVLSGPGEQDLPACAAADVIARHKERPAERAGSWRAEVVEVTPRSPLWDEVTPLLAERRLNAAQGAEQPVRWAAECLVRALVPIKA